MLPAALKAKYEKVSMIIDDKKNELPSRFYNLFKNDHYYLEEVIEAEHAPYISKGSAKGSS